MKNLRECNKGYYTIAIIPARGGSKSIPCKNTVNVGGKPLIAWSIKKAKESRFIDDVFVSTDDKRIARISREHGAGLIARPASLAGDRSSSEAALLHAIDYIENVKKMKIDIVVFLQATSPVRERSDIDNAIKKFLKEKADSLFSCSKMKDYFIWARRASGFASITYDYHRRSPRQAIGERYLENGSIYIFKPELIRRRRNRLGGRIAVYEMPFWRSFQIDEKEDIGICEYYLKQMKLKKQNKKRKRKKSNEK